jgi:predicted exporter
VAAFESAALSYLTRFCSYAAALWSSVEGESQMVCSTLFRIVAAMTEQVWLAQQQIQTALLDAGKSVPAVEAICENAMKARSAKKCVRLHALTKLFVLAQILLDIPVLESLHRLFATRTEYKFSFLNTRENLRLSAPHYQQQQPF